MKILEQDEGQVEQVNLLLSYIKGKVDGGKGKLVDYNPLPILNEAAGVIYLEELVREGKFLCLDVRHTIEYPIIDVRTDPNRNAAFCQVSGKYRDQVLEGIADYEKTEKPLSLDVKIDDLGKFQRIVVNGKQSYKQIN